MLQDPHRLSPRERYQRDVASGLIAPDAAQRAAVTEIEILYHALAGRAAAGPAPFLRRWLAQRMRGPRTAPGHGLYLWGSVGRGKTYLMDTLFDSLPFAEKMRVHFHSFVQGVHRDLKRLFNITNPLEVVADRLASRARVLCLDELHVSDITDAMLLGNLLHGLFARGVVLVATSNEPPDRLYWDGLQRQRFLPAIDLIQSQMRVIDLGRGVDYRLRVIETADIYHTPLGQAAEQGLANCFERLVRGPGRYGSAIEIDGRGVETVRHADGVVWFDFPRICHGPRGVRDYLEIAACYHTVLLADIPQMDGRHDDSAKRFITLIDALYDRNVKLVVSAAAAPPDLYRGARLVHPFQRTASRLQEMRTHAYLARPHSA